MNFKLNIPLKLQKKTSSKVTSNTIDNSLPYSLYPLYVTLSSMQAEVKSDYNIDLAPVIPEFIAKDFERYGIELSIAKPHVFIT